MPDLRPKIALEVVLAIDLPSVSLMVSVSATRIFRPRFTRGGNDRVTAFLCRRKSQSRRSRQERHDQIYRTYIHLGNSEWGNVNRVHRHCFWGLRPSAYSDKRPLIVTVLEHAGLWHLSFLYGAPGIRDGTSLRHGQ